MVAHPVQKRFGVLWVETVDDVANLIEFIRESEED